MRTEQHVVQQEERARDQEAQAKQEEVQKNILNFLRSKGYDDTLTYGVIHLQIKTLIGQYFILAIEPHYMV